MRRSLISVLVLVLGACSSTSTSAQSGGHTPRAPALADGQAEAIFAGGCFWCMEHPFERLDGVASVTSGYIGGRVEGPSYEQVSRGGTGHAEAVRVVYDPDVIGYERLLEVFWRNIDPFQRDGQFCDHGDQYRTAIFPVNAEQRRLAQASLERLRRERDRPIATRIEPSATFWVAEDYHQDFYRTHPVRYRTYRSGCGRDARLRELWGE
ncbi:MAG: peptide-methionine (S)-S-oxide reductase MsrA [Myxococcota bacterium]|nr:peptide-methionine (S)-S-oxide reductase MsrA [Myxococcota bacterium]